jgi:hypothetical protein
MSDVPILVGSNRQTAAGGDYFIIRNFNETGSTAFIFKRNARSLKYDLVHKHSDVDVHQVATNGKWFAVHGTNGETVIFQLDASFNEINKASFIHETKYMHIQEDDSLISVYRSIDSFQRSTNGTWVKVDSLPITAEEVAKSAKFSLDRVIIHAGELSIHLFKRHNSFW